MQGSIERKLLNMFFLAMALTLGIVSVVSYLSSDSEKLAQGKQLNSEMASLGLRLIDSEMDDLDVITSAYAQWDATYDYINQPSTSFIRDNFSQDVLNTIEVSGVMIERLDGQVLYSISKNSIDDDKELWHFIQKNMPILTDFNQRGALFFKGRLYMLASLPVTDNTATSSANGRIVMIKAIDSSVTGYISSVLDMDFSVVPVLTDNKLFLMSGIGPWKLEAVNYHIQDQSMIGSYQMLSLEEGNLPSIVALRTEYRTQSLSQLIIEWSPSFFAMMLLPSIMTYLLRRHITKPMTELVNWLNQVDGSTLAEELRPFKHVDKGEIGQLSTKFSEIYNNLYQEHQFSQLLLYSISDCIFTVDHMGCVDYCNPAASEWLNIKAGSIYGQSFELLIDNLSEDTSSPAHWLHRALHCGSEYSGISLIRKLGCSQGTEWMEIQVSPMIKSEEEQPGAIIILRPKNDYKG